MIDSLIKIFAFQVLGDTAVSALSLPVPGPVVGMLLLFLYLLARGRKDENLDRYASGALRHLALLFIPAAVGITLHLNRVVQEWIPILVALTASTLLSTIVTAVVVQQLKKHN